MKFYEGQPFLRPKYIRHKNTVSVRLSDEEIKILDKLYPECSRSYQIRSVIHAYGSVLQSLEDPFV